MKVLLIVLVIVGFGILMECAKYRECRKAHAGWYCLLEQGE